MDKNQDSLSHIIIRFDVHFVIPLRADPNERKEVYFLASGPGPSMAIIVMEYEQSLPSLGYFLVLTVFLAVGFYLSTLCFPLCVAVFSLSLPTTHRYG